MKRHSDTRDDRETLLEKASGLGGRSIKKSCYPEPRPRLDELQQATEALRASEATYRAIFDTANNAIFVHDLKTGRILDVNRKMTEMYGYTREEARRLSVEDVSAGVPPYRQKDAVGRLRKAAES